MTSPLDRLAEVLGRMTSGPWETKGNDVRANYTHHYHHMAFASTPANAQGIALLRNLAEPLLAVARVSRRFYTSATGSDASLAEYEQMYAAFTALDAAIESELGTKETT